MHPYKNLRPAAFWRTAVSEKNFLDLSDVYRKKFGILASDRIVSAGSCFAQHIARKMSASGFNYQDYEPPPPGFPADKLSEFGYGVFSARYGNIYTARQLLQLFERAFEDRRPEEDVWVSNSRFYDPYRPAIEPDGFPSMSEFMASRESHMRAVRKVFSESDVFIFTLGLTETWRSVADGSVFPICPGTSCGQFEAARHEFHNFSFMEVLGDLQLLIRKVREINQGLRFILTVSPVPLTATAGPEHVMVATSYSKSLLRAVAGEIASNDPLVDYFPSYELVSAPPVRGALFEPNLRSVSGRGVDIVMRHFFEQHQPCAAKEPVNGKAKDSAETGESPKHADDVVCEEAMLDKFAL